MKRRVKEMKRLRMVLRMKSLDQMKDLVVRMKSLKKRKWTDSRTQSKSQMRKWKTKRSLRKYSMR